VSERRHEEVSAEKAASLIASGSRIVLANLCAEPHLLPDAIMDRSQELRGVRIFHLKPCGRFIERYLEPRMEEHIRCATAFAGGSRPIIQLMKEGRADFYPLPLSKVPWLFRDGHFKPDVFITTVSPPDDRGFCNLGISVDYALAALQTARTVIAEVNENMPRTSGESRIHISKIDYLVNTNEAIYEMPSPEPGDLERRLAENVASLVDDRATIQIGFGRVSESIPRFLSGKRDLGLHSEMFPESAIMLVEDGTLTGRMKSIDVGKAVCSFTAGTKRLYEWLNENETLEMRPFDYTNDSRIIASNRQMTAINTALQVDLYGNIYSDMLGYDEYSGAGGQPDFVLGASLCPNGKSIVVLPSTTSNGLASRIVSHPSITTNTRAPRVPTVTRFHADYVVTEWGSVSLKEKTTAERARALIDISHSRHQDDLRKEARKLGLLS